MKTRYRRNRKLKRLGQPGVEWESDYDVNNNCRAKQKQQDSALANEQLDAVEKIDYEDCWCSKPDCSGCEDYYDKETFYDWLIATNQLNRLPE